MSPYWTSLELRVIELVVNNWSYKTCKAPVKSSTNQHPAFYRPEPFLSPNQQCQSTYFILPLFYEKLVKAVSYLNYLVDVAFGGILQ